MSLATSSSSASRCSRPSSDQGSDEDQEEEEQPEHQRKAFSTWCLTPGPKAKRRKKQPHRPVRVVLKPNPDLFPEQQETAAQTRCQSPRTRTQDLHVVYLGKMTGLSLQPKEFKEIVIAKCNLRAKDIEDAHILSEPLKQSKRGWVRCRSADVAEKVRAGYCQHVAEAGSPFQGPSVGENDVGPEVGAVRTVPIVHLDYLLKEGKFSQAGLKEWLGGRCELDSAAFLEVAIGPEPLRRHYAGWVECSTKEVADQVVEKLDGKTPTGWLWPISAVLEVLRVPNTKKKRKAASSSSATPTSTSAVASAASVNN